MVSTSDPDNILWFAENNHFFEKSLASIMPMIGARFYNQLDAANARADLLENCLAREVENGRLFRIIVKLNTVVERHE
jgi:PAB-dependent poly(A)-specific ribonuclease subunit 3